MPAHRVPESFAASKAEVLGGPGNRVRQIRRLVGRKLHVNWRCANGHQLKRVFADVEKGNPRLSGRADEVMSQCEVCQALEKEPALPVAGTSPAAPFSKKLQADLLFPDRTVALCAVAMYSKNPLWVKAW